MKIARTLFPGSIGSIVALHGRFYAKHWRFTTFFEAKVASELAAFAQRQRDADLVLVAHDATGVVGSLVLDLNDPGSAGRGAHLRWFICADRCRGTGLGRHLLETAMDHALVHADGQAWLTTFAGLDPARRLYESCGFRLVSEEEGDVWGTVVRQQEFHRQPALHIIP